MMSPVKVCVILLVVVSLLLGRYVAVGLSVVSVERKAYEVFDDVPPEIDWNGKQAPKAASCHRKDDCEDDSHDKHLRLLTCVYHLVVHVKPREYDTMEDESNIVIALHHFGGKMSLLIIFISISFSFYAL